MSDVKHVVSFSQLKMYVNCPYQWYLHYQKKIRDDQPSIHLIFGSAMHEVIQTYLKTVFEDSVKNADKLNLEDLLKYRLAYHYNEAKKQYETDTPATEDEMVEFYYDGLRIIEWLKKHRGDYFNTRKYKLMGVELPLKKPVLPGVEFTGFVDIALQDVKDNKVKIIDLKTSGYGWRSYQKSDDNIASQLVLYKIYFSELYDVSPDSISVEFLVLKRKLLEKTDFPQKRIQRVTPASGKMKMRDAKRKMELFLENAFTPSGDYNEDGFFPKLASEKNCRFCYFNDKPDLCNKKN